MASQEPRAGRMTEVKLVTLGESAVGKSCLALRFLHINEDNYKIPEHSDSTIGAAFVSKPLTIGNEVFKFNMWDTAGQERFHALASMYYRNAHVALIVYDITQAATLDKAKSWVKELQRQVPDIYAIALVGNKRDLADEKPENRAVATADAEAYAKEAGLMFFEISVKADPPSKITDIFESLAKKVPLDQVRSRRGRHPERISLRPENAATQVGGPCNC